MRETHSMIFGWIYYNECLHIVQKFSVRNFLLKDRLQCDSYDLHWQIRLFLSLFGLRVFDICNLKYVYTILTMTLWPLRILNFGWRQDMNNILSFTCCVLEFSLNEICIDKNIIFFMRLTNSTSVRQIRFCNVCIMYTRERSYYAPTPVYLQMYINGFYFELLDVSDSWLFEKTNVIAWINKCSVKTFSRLYLQSWNFTVRLLKKMGQDEFV